MMPASLQTKRVLPYGIALVVIGIISYFGIGQLVGAFQLSEFRSALRRQSAK